MIPVALGSPDNWFEKRFAYARRRLLDHLSELEEQGLAPEYHEIFKHPQQGPYGESLATDAIWLGSLSAENVIVLGSATHGAEGYAGSAIQSFILHCLTRNKLRLPPNCALVLVHALNPWGMAWHRRCDEQGIDVNRNFIDFSQPLPQPVAYELVRECLTEPDEVRREKALTSLLDQLGQQGFDEAVFGGQYHDPLAPFYGGQQKSFSREVTESVLKQFALAGRNLMVIDLHTGLGPWGYGELICDHPIDTPQEAFAMAAFGESVAMPARGNSFSAVKEGLLDYAWHQVMSERSCFLTLEFGTYDSRALLKTLVDEHLVWAGDSDAKVKHGESYHRMMQHFCPNDIYWRQSVLFKSWQVMDRLCSGDVF
jgi:predicted deacylase